jgi:hypothetical protein
VTLLVSACGFVFASDPVAKESTAFKDSFPHEVSYPATMLGPKVDGPTDTLIRQVVNSRYGGPSDYRYDAYTSPRHPLLDRVLPGASFMRVFIRGLLPEMRTTQRYVVAGPKLYGLDALNRVLLEAGFNFDSTEMPTIAKIAVLFATFGKTFDASGQVRDGQVPTDSSPGAGFPAITFLSVKTGEWQHPIHKDVRRGVLADCMVDGQRMHLFVEFVNSGRPEPQAVYSPGGSFMLLLGVIPVPKLPPLQKRGDHLEDSPSWYLVLTSDRISGKPEHSAR